jgi:hypothetical protein
MTTNLSPKDKEISEIEKNRSESAWNRFNIFNTFMLLILTASTFVINSRIENLKQEIETAKFMESTIDNLAGTSENREIALSVLYSAFILEKQEQSSLRTGFNLFELFDSHEIPHQRMLSDLADTVLQVSFPSSKILETSKAIDILCALEDPKCSYWQNQRKDKSKPSDRDENSNTFANIIQSKQGQGKKGLVFIQYNDESKKPSIDSFRNELSANWNAPGIEFIENYTAHSDKLGDIRYFHDNEKELAQELQKFLNNKYCPQKECFGEPQNLSKNYPNLPPKQFEIWIDAKNEKIK